MAVLGTSQKPIIMPHYPHFLAEDTAVWTRYLASPVKAIKEVWYDVHVGRAVPIPEGGGDLERRISRGVTRKRIDVVARVDSSLWVIEIKPFAGMQALGQIIAYHRMFVEEFQPVWPTWPVIICDKADYDVVSTFDALGVIVIAND